MNYIIDPQNGNTYSIFSQNGKNLLKKYVNVYQTGGAEGVFSKKIEKKRNELKKTFGLVDEKILDELMDKYKKNLIEREEARLRKKNNTGSSSTSSSSTSSSSKRTPPPKKK